MKGRKNVLVVHEKLQREGATGGQKNRWGKKKKARWGFGGRGEKRINQSSNLSEDLNLRGTNKVKQKAVPAIKGGAKGDDKKLHTKEYQGISAGIEIKNRYNGSKTFATGNAATREKTKKEKSKKGLWELDSKEPVNEKRVAGSPKEIAWTKQGGLGTGRKSSAQKKKILRGCERL